MVFDMPWSGKRSEARVRHFWTDALTWYGTVTPLVMPQVLLFGVYGVLVGLVHEWHDWPGLESGPVQFTAAFLALLLVLRTNSGYERWWEARKLWGGIVNQSRNLAIIGLSYGPDDRAWREKMSTADRRTVTALTAPLLAAYGYLGRKHR